MVGGSRKKPLYRYKKGRAHGSRDVHTTVACGASSGAGVGVACVHCGRPCTICTECACRRAACAASGYYGRGKDGCAAQRVLTLRLPTFGSLARGARSEREDGSEASVIMRSASGDTCLGSVKDVKGQFEKKIAESPNYKPPTPKNVFLPSEGGPRAHALPALV